MDSGHVARLGELMAEKKALHSTGLLKALTLLTESETGLGLLNHSLEISL